MLNYEEFKEKLIEMVQSELGKGVSVRCAAMEGNDRMIKEGIVLEGETEPFSLCIRLDELYQNYLRTGNIQMCARLVVKLERMNESVNYDAVLDTWENLKSRIFIKLVNSKRNQKRLRNLPHRDFHDVSLLCYMMVCELQETSVTMTVNHQLLDYWGITESVLWDAAMENLGREAFYIEDLEKIHSEILGTEPNQEHTGLQYVMTNENKYCGARAMLRKDLLSMFADAVDADLYIIPSAVHEIILIPNNGAIKAKDLQNILIAVNETMVEEEEQLSDHIYYFNREERMVTMINDALNISDFL